MSAQNPHTEGSNFVPTKVWQKRKATLVRSMLGGILKRAGLEDKIEKYSFVLRWEEIVGADLYRRTKVESLTDGLLLIRVESSALAAELNFQKGAIASRVRKFLPPGQKVRQIRFCVGSL